MCLSIDSRLGGMRYSFAGLFCMVPAIQALSAGVAAVALLQHLGVTGCLQ